MQSIGKRFNTLLLRWQQHRAPRNRRVILTQRNTYIFPTRYGFLLLLIVLLMGIGATNYQNNLIFIATFTVIALGLLSILLTYANLVGLRLTAHCPDSVFAGQMARFPISITSEKNHYAVSLQLESGGLHTIDVIAGAEHRVELSQECPTRGIYPLGRVRCQTLYPLGFLQAWSWVFLDAECIVYPRPIEPDARFTVGKSSRDEPSSSYQTGTEEFYGLRSYQKGDLLSRIHWKSFAREKGLQTKQFVDYLHDPEAFNYDDFPGVDKETRLSYLSHLLVQAEQEGKRFGLILPGVSVAIGTGEEHLHRCLTQLATYDLGLEAKPFGDVNLSSQSSASVNTDKR
jgi:uncharacterized protein (DUF58 family)